MAVSFMKYSSVNGERVEAHRGLRGQCLVCGNTTIARCGLVRRSHWAHKVKQTCDPWWENETKWHRAWKDQFPKEWQEIIQYAENGEKHVADVKTIQGYVIEFQHSHIKQEERQAREDFYKKMVWVVDGTGRGDQFLKALNERPIPITSLLRKVRINDSVLLTEWSNSRVPVFFDFGKEVLWCLLPTSQNIWGCIVECPRHEFIELHKDENQSKNFEKWLNEINYLVNPTTCQIQAPIQSAPQVSISQLFRPKVLLRRGPRINAYTRYR